MEKELYWYNNAIIYAIDIGVFKDGNNDGVGDFKGATEKLDYLHDLGVNCLWLLPFFESSEKDNGYDVEDYYGLNKKFGTYEDFMRFKGEAEKRDMRLIVDLVVHHTSDNHPWFKLATHNKDSKYYNYYIWNPDPPAIPEDNVFKGKTWKYVSRLDEYYYHKFYDFEPDLNVRNPEVRREIKEIIRYWLDFGAAGFRLDAATHLFDPFLKDGNTSPEEIMEDFHSFLTSLKKDAFYLAEADVVSSRISDFIGKGNRMNILFNFLLNNSLFLALARGKATPIFDRLKELPSLPPNVQWANFIRNLDELDLEQLSADEREEVFQAFAPNKNMQVYGRGIRRRLTPMVDGNVQRIKMIYNLMFALPGVPVIIYGDEIGMGDNLVYKGRTAVRTPMQWDDSKNGGFSEAPEDAIEVKPIKEGPFSYHFVNVEAQQQDTDSLMNEIKKFIHIRKEISKLYSEDPRLLEVPREEVFAIDYSDDVVIFINFSDKPLQMDTGYNFSEYEVLLEDSSYGLKNKGSDISLKPYGYRWFKKL